MNRSDLIARIASRWPVLTAKDVEAAVATILSALATKLAEGGVDNEVSTAPAANPPERKRNAPPDAEPNVVVVQPAFWIYL